MLKRRHSKIFKQDLRFGKVYREDDEKIVQFLQDQIETHLVRPDYKEFIELPQV